MQPTLRLAVFDVDGTLVDSQHNIVAAMAAAWRRHDLGEPRPEAVRRIIGLSLVEAVAALLPECDSGLHERVAQSYKDAFFELRQSPDHAEPLFPRAVEALATLERQGWLLAVATGKSRRGLARMIERHGWERRFVSLQTADDNPSKPHPAMLQRAMADSGASPGDTAMIGDTSFDMLMARAAGVVAVGVGWGNHTAADLIAAGATTVVRDFRHLPGLLEARLGEKRCVPQPS